MNNRVLILGCNSFSGASTTRALLENGFQVFGISRSEMPPKYYLPFDSRNPNFEYRVMGSHFDPNLVVDICRSENIGKVINFVAQSMVAESWLSPEDWYMTNCVWLAHLASCLDAWGGIEKFIQFSTPEVYGSTNGWTSESFQFNPTTPYAISRAAGDLHLRALHKNKDFPVIFTRAANIYGPYQPIYRIVPKTILSSMFGYKIPLHGGGLSVRSFIYSEDVANAVMTILLNGKAGEVYHISTQESLRISDLVDMIFEIKGVAKSNYIDVVEDRRGKDEAYLLSSAKIRRDLGWNDFVTLRDGVGKTIEWAREFSDELRKAPANYVHRR